jgi:hypothetical protein
MIAKDPETVGSMLVPIILGSDKTTVSVATGNNEYYPLYLSIGNIHNNVRRAHRNGLVLLAFLAIPKSDVTLWFVFYVIDVSFQPIRSMPTMQNFGNSAVSSFTPRLLAYLNPWSLEWAARRSSVVQIVISDVQYIGLVHT